jgi:hypothetical protein
MELIALTEMGLSAERVISVLYFAAQLCPEAVESVAK